MGQVDKSVPCLDKVVCKKYRYCKPPEEEDRINAEWRAKNKEKQDRLDDESKRNEEQQEVKRKKKKLEKRKKKEEDRKIKEEEKKANAEEAEKQVIEDEKKAKKEKQEAEQKAKEEKTKDKPLEVQAFLSSQASKHGVASDQYLRARTRAEWEELVVSMADQIRPKAPSDTPPEEAPKDKQSAKKEDKK